MLPRHQCITSRTRRISFMNRRRVTQQGAADEKNMLRLADGICIDRCMVYFLWPDAGSGIEAEVANPENPKER